MLCRLRKTWRLSCAAVLQAGRWTWDAFDREDVLTLLGLVLVGAGFWRCRYALGRPLALIVPGVVLLWMFLPPRPPFFEAPRRQRPTP